MTRTVVRTLGVLGTLFAMVVGAVLLEGRRVQQTMLRLPEAKDPDGIAGHGPPFHLVVIGDSVAAGVGVEHHGVSLVGRLAEELADQREVRRTVIARSGIDAAQTRELVAGHPALAGADAVVISVGVNDIKHLHSTRRWRRDLDGLLAEVTRTAPQAVVVLIGIAPMERFVFLPRIVRSPLGARSRRMDRVGRAVAARHPRVRRMEIDAERYEAVPEPFAEDGLHPSEATYALFAAAIAEIIRDAEHGRS